MRFVQVAAGGWDNHANLSTSLRGAATNIDGPAAALIQDLKKRGLLDQTLVIWGGEFGRTVVKDRNGNADPGCDHNGRGFCCWMAGGGIKGGRVLGEQVRVDAGTLFQQRDYPVLNEYRATLGGLFARMYGLNSSQLAQVFSGVRAKDIGIV